MTKSPDNETIKRFYRWNAPIYDLTRWTILRGRKPAIDALKINPGDRVLDVGCGTGLNLPRLSETAGPEGLVVGLDLSIHLLGQAKHKHRSNISLICADACHLPLSGPFDAILLTYALTIIPDWHQALDQAYGLLKSGGRLVILDFGHHRSGFHPFRSMFDLYLLMNHVDSHRELLPALEKFTSKVDIIKPTHAYATILRGWKP